MIVLGYPVFLLPLFGIIAGVILFYIRNSKSYTLPLELYHGSPFKKPPLLLRLLYYAGCFFMIAGWLLTGTASLDPAYITRESRSINTNSIVLYLIDASPSMSASDIPPTRFARAVELIETSVKETDALHGLIAFGKDAVLVCPPTPQTDIFLERLYTVKPGFFGDGTNILTALKSALVQVSIANLPDAVIVVLSDGEDYESINQFAMALEHSSAKAKIYFTALGKGGDVPVTYIDPFTQETTSGMYRSQFDEEKLKASVERANIMFSSNPQQLDIVVQGQTISERLVDYSANSQVELLSFALLLFVLGFVIVFGIFGGNA